MTSGKRPILFYILTVAGIILAGLSGTDLCTFGGCTEAHSYRFFGIHLTAVGLAFFVTLAATHIAAVRFPKVGELIAPLIAAGTGAELMMLHLQKNVIKAWCPLCVGIAVIVLLLGILQLLSFILESRRLPTMNRRKFFAKSLLTAAALLAGFLVSFNGITQPEAAVPQLESALGKQNSKIEVYVFSDWLCPMCVKIEPAIEAVFPAMEKKAKVFFIDKVIHQEAMNFVPYHLSFLANEKAKYLQLRKALFTLAKKNRNPSLEDVKKAIAPLGVTYKQLSFMDVTQMMGKSQALAAQFNVTATPTVVITNNSTKKTKTLVGGTEITQDNILKAINALE